MVIKIPREFFQVELSPFWKQVSLQMHVPPLLSPDSDPSVLSVTDTNISILNVYVEDLFPHDPAFTRKEGREIFCQGLLSPPLCLPPTPVCPHSDGWLSVLASSDREICHLTPGRGDSKSISMETAVTCRLLSRPLGAGFFFASHLSSFSPPLFYTSLSKSSFEQMHLAPIAYANSNNFEFVCYCLAKKQNKTNPTRVFPQVAHY